MGSGSNYSGQIDSALSQANTPKSNLAQEYSGLMGGIAPGILSSLLNTQNLGNSFLNVNGANSNGGGNQGYGTGSNSPYVNNFHPNAYNPPNVHPFTMAGGGDPNINPGGNGGQVLSMPNSPSLMNASPEMQGFLNQGAMYDRSGAHGPITFPGGNPTVPHPTGINPPVVLPPGSQGGVTTVPPNSNNPPAQYGSNGLYGDIERNGYNQGSGMGIGQGQQGGINLQGFQGANPHLANINQQGLNPQALQTLLGGSFNPQIQQLLGMVGGQPQNVNAQQVGPSGFNQQMADPSMIQNPGFQAQGANLGGINTGTELSGGSQDSYNAIANILQNQQKQAMADQHERFTGIGGARSTGASLADAQLQAQMQPQLAQALNSARNNEVSNQLQSAGLQSSNALANTGMMNQYGLGGAQLDVQRQGQNISNMLSAAGINNQYGLGGAQLNSQNNQANQSANLQGQMANQNAGLQNQGMNNNLLSQLLGQQGTNTMGALGAMNQNQQNQNQGILGQNDILRQLAQSNSSGQNAFNLGVAGMNQSAAQQQQQNQLQSLLAMFSGGLGLAGAGIPGGSANVNIGNGNNGSNFGSNMAGLASVLSMFG